MYKKIIHNIVEEHYDHPMTLKMVNHNGLATVWPPLPSKFEFTSALKAQLNKLNSNLHNLIVSKLANNDDLKFITDNLYNIDSDFSSLISYYLDRAATDAAIKPLNAFIKTIDDAITSVKNGDSVGNTREKAIEFFKDFLNLMSLNSIPDLINVPYVELYVENLIQSIISRSKKDFNNEAKSVDLARTIIANGPIYDIPFSGRQDLATLIGNNITTTYSAKFRQ